MQRKILITSILLLLLSCNNYAQYLHTPSEIKKLMENSDQVYILDTLGNVPAKPDFSALVTPGWYGFSTPEGITLEKPYSLTTKTQKKYHKKAKKYYLKGKYIKSIELYKKSLIFTPTNSEIMHLLAEVYRKAGDPETVIFWYKKAVFTNPLDGIAYAKLGAIYRDEAKTELAIEHFTMAHLLNRNDTAILNQLKLVYQQEKKSFLDFDFAPSYEIRQADSSVLILADEIPWAAFAACKALWQVDEKYVEKMRRLSNDNINVIEEKECLLNALLAYERMDTDKTGFPELRALGNALKNNRIEEFLLYEIYARQDPLLLLRLEGAAFEKIKDYLVTCKLKNHAESKD